FGREKPALTSSLVKFTNGRVTFLFSFSCLGTLKPQLRRKTCEKRHVAELATCLPVGPRNGQTVLAVPEGSDQRSRRDRSGRVDPTNRRSGSRTSAHRGGARAARRSCRSRSRPEDFRRATDKTPERGFRTNRNHLRAGTGARNSLGGPILYGA